MKITCLTNNTLTAGSFWWNPSF